MLGIQAAALIKVDTSMTSGDSYVTVTPVNTPETPPGLSTPRNVLKKKEVTKIMEEHGRHVEVYAVLHGVSLRHPLLHLFTAQLRKRRRRTSFQFSLMSNKNYIFTLNEKHPPKGSFYP